MFNHHQIALAIFLLCDKMLDAQSNYISRNIFAIWILVISLYIAGISPFLTGQLLLYFLHDVGRVVMGSRMVKEGHRGR